MNSADDTPASAAVNSHDADTPSDLGLDSKRPEGAVPSARELREDQAKREGGDAKDATTKTMTDQAKKAGGGTDEENKGLKP